MDVDREKLRQNSTRKFLLFMEKHGGFFTRDQVLLFTGMTGDKLDELLLERKIIRINVSSSELFPAFQFEKNKVETVFHEILTKIPNSISSVHVCSFFLSKTTETLLEEALKSPAEILMAEPTAEQIHKIKRDASVLGSMGR